MKTITNPTAHNFDSTGDAYNASQCDDTIRDGDVLGGPERERGRRAPARAWPTAVTAEHGAFHTSTNGSEWSCLMASEGRTDTYTVFPAQVHRRGQRRAVLQHEWPLPARTRRARRAARSGSWSWQLNEHTETIPADPGTDYSASVTLARTYTPEENPMPATKSPQGPADHPRRAVRDRHERREPRRHASDRRQRRVPRRRARRLGTARRRRQGARSRRMRPPAPRQAPVDN